MSTSIKRVFDLIPYNQEKFNNASLVNGKVHGTWHSLGIEAFIKKSDALSKGLIKLGLGKGSRAAIMSPNRIEWNVCDFAIMQIGAYQIPLYPTLGEQDIRFIIDDADISVLFVADAELYKKAASVISALGREVKLYTFNNVNGASHWEELLVEDDAIDLNSFRNAVTEEDILTIIYTSGTTGTPKGVVLSHNNLVENIKNSAVIFPSNIRTVVSFLPLSHIFERMIVYMYVYLGVEIYYAESMDTIVADIQYVRPNGFSCVPRLLEKIYDKIMEKGKTLTGIKRMLFFWSVGLAERYERNKGPLY
ncbi:MAG: long-chain fatty acid--CoA ligase, partial [Chitinophagaceae bacterium]